MMILTSKPPNLIPNFISPLCNLPCIWSDQNIYIYMKVPSNESYITKLNLWCGVCYSVEGLGGVHAWTPMPIHEHTHACGILLSYLIWGRVNCKTLLDELVWLIGGPSLQDGHPWGEAWVFAFCIPHLWEGDIYP